MTLQELTATKQALQQSLHRYELIVPCCHSCENFAEGTCKQFNAAPPEPWHRGPVECDHWVYDSVPF